MQYDNTNRFSLFRNDRKTEDRDPDYTGSLNVDGVEFFIDAWDPKTPGGKLVFSGRVKRKTQQAKAASSPGAQYGYQPPRRPNGQPAPLALDDDIPF
jgi:hypothetical protein